MKKPSFFFRLKKTVFVLCFLCIFFYPPKKIESSKVFGLHKGLAAWIFSYFDFTFEHQNSCTPKGPLLSYQKPQRFQKFLVRHFILRHSSHCELRYCWTTFVPLTAVLWEIGAIPTQTWPQIRISCWRAILVWKLMQRFTTILALPLEIQTLANLKHRQKLLYSETYM